jgi:flagellar hook-length control protein FliK
MNTLPLPALLPQQAAQPAAALLAVLAPSVPITALGAAAAAPAPAQPGSFDRTLQLLLNAAAALPTPGSAAPALAAPAQDDTDTSAADAGTALQFDPALASLQPPTAIAVPLPAVVGTPAEAPPRPVAAAAATVAVQAATGAAPALPASVAAPAPAAVAPPLPAAKPQAAPADTATTALSLERPSVAAGLVPAAASAPQDSVEPRSGEAAPQGRAPSLMQQLGDRIAVQIERGSERVVIRLDPPHRGQIEIHIRQDASGTTQVQLSASHGDVVRQLQAIGDGLRQELAQRHGGDVSVQVAQQQARGDAEGRQRQGEQRQQQPGRALDEQSEAGQRFALATDRS